MDYRPLEQLDHAKALVDCVYAVYGLTFHREYAYDPKRLLDLNQSGRVRCFLAMDGPKVVGHLAWIRPFFELSRNGEPLSDERTGEVGLSIVHPDHRSQHVQTGLALAMARWATERGAYGAFMKCVTNHVFSQKTALALGGRPLALFLAGVPKWVVYDQAPGERPEPISTLLAHVVFSPPPPQVLRLPPGTPWLADLVRRSGLARPLADGGPLEEGPTDLELEFQPSKHLAQVHVLHAGEDLLPRLESLNRWLLGGHMKHVAYYLPADSARVQAGAAAIEACGLFAGGWVPCLHAGGRDVLVYTAIAYDRLDLNQIHVQGEAAETLKRAVASGWRRAAPSVPPPAPLVR